MANDVEFPDCLLLVLKERITTIKGVSGVHLRELTPEDENGSVGITFEAWMPNQDSLEMGGGHMDSTLSDYVINIEHLVKHANREEGLAAHRSVARSIRSMLYRDPGTQVRLRQLAFVGAEYRERLQRWSLEQRFANNQIKTAFYFVSGTTITFQTETV
jgi:hypothetical protein